MSTTIHTGDVFDGLAKIESGTVQTCVTSPPYWGLRDYGTATWEGGDAACDHKPSMDHSKMVAAKSTLVGTRQEHASESRTSFRGECGKCGAKRIDNQIGLESSPDEYVARMVAVFREVRRCLRDDGTLWLNLGSSYASGGTSPTQSRFDALACGSDGKQLRGSLAAGRVCPDCGGELLDGSQIRRDYIENTSRQHAPTQQPPLQKVRGSGRSDCETASRHASSGDVPNSTTHASSLRGQDACGLSEMASELQSTNRTYAGSAQESADNSACKIDTASNVRPSVSGMLGTGFFCMACGYCTKAYPTFKPKDLVNIPMMVAEALQADGWWLRSVIVWAKKSPMPESVTDRPTSSWEPIFLLAKSSSYYYDAEAVREAAKNEGLPMKMADGWDTGEGGHGTIHRSGREKGEYLGAVVSGRNQRNVWHLGPEPYAEAHFATFPTEIPRRCIMAGSRPGDLVLDPFLGSGTTLAVASQLGRRGVGCELNPEYVKLAHDRIGRATRPNTYQSDKVVDAPLFGVTP